MTFVNLILDGRPIASTLRSTCTVFDLEMTTYSVTSISLPSSYSVLSPIDATLDVAGLKRLAVHSLRDVLGELGHAMNTMSLNH